jgi:hypothetical protein
MALLLGSCGGDASAPASTTAAASTTVPEATTTSADPAAVHPILELVWGGLWPEDGATAVFDGETFMGDRVEVPASIAYGVDWDGGTWDRLTFGTVEPGRDGAAVYFDRSEPWRIRAWGWVASSPALPGRRVQESFSPPLLLDFTTAPLSLEGEVVASGWGDAPEGFEFHADFSVDLTGETVVVPAGEFEGAIHAAWTVGGEWITQGGPEDAVLVSEFWFHPEAGILRWVWGPGLRNMELVEPWE